MWNCSKKISRLYTCFYSGIQIVKSFERLQELGLLDGEIKTYYQDYCNVNIIPLNKLVMRYYDSIARRNKERWGDLDEKEVDNVRSEVYKKPQISKPEWRGKLQFITSACWSFFFVSIILHRFNAFVTKYNKELQHQSFKYQTQPRFPFDSGAVLLNTTESQGTLRRAMGFASNFQNYNQGLLYKSPYFKKKVMSEAVLRLM